MRGPDPERRVRKFICEDTLPRGCENWDGNRCIIEADEDCCADAYSDGAFPWDAYKDEAREQMEERMSEQKDICEVTECEYYCTDCLPYGCRVGADKIECVRYMVESGKGGWEFYVRSCAKQMIENVEWLRAKGAAPW